MQAPDASVTVNLALAKPAIHPHHLFANPLLLINVWLHSFIQNLSNYISYKTYLLLHWVYKSSISMRQDCNSIIIFWC